MALAGAGQAFVSWTTVDLLGGIGDLVVETAGSHELKGLDGAREISGSSELNDIGAHIGNGVETQARTPGNRLPRA